MRAIIAILILLAVRPLYDPRDEVYEGLTFRWNNYQVKVRRIEGELYELVSSDPEARIVGEGHWLLRSEVLSIMKGGSYDYDTGVRTIRKCPYCDGQFSVFKEYRRPCPNCGNGKL